jgi:hypothetical protein
MAAIDLSEMTREEIIATGLKIRLNQLRPYINYWDESIAL